jgi:hypothetical protein
MSEESQVFRGDRAPERASVGGGAVQKKPATEPQARADASPAAQPVAAESFAAEPEAGPSATPAPVVAAPAPVAPAPELKLEVDPSQLWHSSQVLRQRMAQLHSTAAATAHVLDEQEADARRIAKQLKSL